MKSFKVSIIWRVLILAAVMCPIPFLWVGENKVLAVILGLITISLIVSLIHFTTSVNKKLTLFFESVQYDDFTVKFSGDNKLGNSFQGLNLQINQVIEAFKQARAEKEANILFLNTLVQHIDVGIICYDTKEQIEILNNTAIRLLGVYRLRELKELATTKDGELYEKIKELKPGQRLMYETKNGMQLSINSTRVSLRGRAVKLISFQNIRSELQQKELSSWQNLTKVLRHEIMNSIAPIVSMVGTMRTIVTEDLGQKEGIEEAVEDLGEALKTIETRGQGVMNFVNAYRDFTTLPKPDFKNIQIAELLQRIETLVRPDAEREEIKLVFNCESDYQLSCDTDQIEMVLINLIKNAMEAIESNGKVEVRAYKENQERFVQVKDNGTGMVSEAIEKVFIPFYTTKKTGQGIGLSLSKQILQSHNGDLTVKSTLGEGSIFRLEF